MPSNGHNRRDTRVIRWVGPASNHTVLSCQYLISTLCSGAADDLDLGPRCPIDTIYQVWRFQPCPEPQRSGGAVKARRARLLLLRWVRWRWYRRWERARQAVRKHRLRARGKLKRQLLRAEQWKKFVKMEARHQAGWRQVVTMRLWRVRPLRVSGKSLLCFENRTKSPHFFFGRGIFDKSYFLNTKQSSKADSAAKKQDCQSSVMREIKKKNFKKSSDSFHINLSRQMYYKRKKGFRKGGTQWCLMRSPPAGLRAPPLGRNSFGPPWLSGGRGNNFIRKGFHCLIFTNIHFHQHFSCPKQHSEHILDSRNMTKIRIQVPSRPAQPAGEKPLYTKINQELDRS